MLYSGTDGMWSSHESMEVLMFTLSTKYKYPYVFRLCRYVLQFIAVKNCGKGIVYIKTKLI